MPEEKPWESYNKPSGEDRAPWEEYANPKKAPRIDDYSGDPAEQSNKIESAISFLEKEPSTKGGLIDVDKDVLRDVMKNPNVTKEQISESIATMQSGNLYYLKNENGVMVPKQLKEGEKPPKGYNVQSVWGTQKDANDDSWYTDLGKSLYNGVIGGAKGVVDLGQAATMLATGEESNYLTKLGNTAEALQVQKDEALNKPIYNTENVNQWADLLDKERFDLSPSALWGTLNMAAESVTSFMGGAKGASTLLKLGPKASAFVGSYLTQLGDNLDTAKEAGLEGREAASFASLTTGVQAAIDAQFGLESTIFRNYFDRPAKEAFKNIATSIEKDAAGKITEQGFKQLAKEATNEYGKIVSTGIKAIGKDALKEGAQEAGQDFVAKAAENLWDKMDINDKKKFGTDATSAKSFASYIQNGLAGIVSGVPMAVISTDAKKKYQEQSANAYATVQKGEEAVNTLKANLTVAKENGSISAEEFDTAITKINAYQKYDEQTKDLNLDEKQKKESFELAFNIEALKSEVNAVSKEDLENLDAIGHAKINAKKETIKGLQKELDAIVEKSELQTETKVGKTQVERVAKELGIEKEKPTLKDIRKRLVPQEPDGGKVDVSPKNERVPVKSIPTVDWNNPNTTSSLRKKQLMQEEMKSLPNNEMAIDLQEGQNGVIIGVLDDNRMINLAQSAKANKEGSIDFIKRENLPEAAEESVDDAGRPLVKYKGKVMAKRVEIDARDINTDEVIKDKDGNIKKKAVISIYNPANGGHIGFQRELDPYKGKYTPSKYSPTEQADLKRITEANHLNEDITPFARVEKVKSKPIEKAVDYNKLARAAESEKELDAVLDQATATDFKIDADVFSKKRAKLKAVKQEPVKEVRKEAKAMKTDDVLTQPIKDSLIDSGYDSATIEKAIKETDRILSLTSKEAFFELKKLGIFNLGLGEKLEARPDVGLKTEEYIATVRQFSQGKETKTTEKLLEFIDRIKETGSVNTIQGTGESSIKLRIPLVYNILGEKSGAERGLTKTEEVEKLAELAAQSQYESQLQKKPSVVGDAQKVLDRIKKVMPKVKVVIDEKMEAAGKVQGNTLTINPYYAGKDTPIHEAAHIFIDAIGYNNKVIQGAINQLKGTKVWKETEKRYPELNEEMLAKEVLAEAIGTEGANIFDKEYDKSKFRAMLEYIYDKLKQLLGINKNIAKSLSKQIIAGIGTKNLEGTTKEAQLKKKTEISEEEKDVRAIIDKIAQTEDLNAYSNEDLVDAYNAVMETELSEGKKDKYLKDVMVRIAMNIFDRQVAMNIKNSPEFNPDEAVRKDISFKDVRLKVLSHFTDQFPTMQYLSKLWDSAYFEKEAEAAQEKNTNEQLAKAVIRDRNKKLGIIDRALNFAESLFANINHKYFDFLENGNGALITLEEAQKKGLSEPQIKYLKYVRSLISSRKKLMEDEDIYNMDMEVLTMDKKFYEAFRSEGITQAFSNLIGNTHNIERVRIEYKDPVTGKNKIGEFKEIEKALVEYGKTNPAAKGKSIALIFKYNMAARRQLKTGRNVDQNEATQENILRVVKGGEYSLDENGNLQSKFSRKRDENRSYSKNFYKAVQEYIDDNTHIKHISPLMPIIDSISYLNKKGVVRDGRVISAEKQNVGEWIDAWKDLHVFKKQKEGVPELDVALRTLRFMTSATTMLFNVPANVINLAMGLYNNWRQENLSTLIKGQARMFGKGGRKLDVAHGFGVTNKYAVDILRKYKVVSTDIDSNPIRTAGGFFAELGFLGQKWGEFNIQGSGVLGLMTEEDYNSFEYKTNQYGVEELTVKKGVDEQALKDRILELRNRVSDVQGKYSDKDQRNIMNNELGKAAFQFKVWIADWWRMRLGEEGSYTQSYRDLMKDGFKELRGQIKDKGVISGLINNDDNKSVLAFKRNLKGALFTAFLMTLVYGDDDDKEKSKAAKLLERVLSDVLFIFDPDNLKFTLTHPVAAIGLVEKFIDAYSHLFSLEEYKTDSKYGKKGDLKFRGDIIGLTPGKKVLDVYDMIDGDE